MAHALMPEVLREFTTRWGVRLEEVASLLGTAPDAIAEAIASDREPAEASFEGALLAGVVYFVLADRAERTGSDASVASWLDEPVTPEARRAALMFHAASVEDVGRWAKAAKAEQT